jgi:phenylpropionate dioxygenase-like ring-hydroxylating dioxygenase large terminal subunit
MLLAEGAGHCDRLLCTYHGWQYGLDGRLVAAPFMGRTDGFSRSEVSLPSLRVELWHDFVFVTYAAQPPPLAPRLRGIEPLLAPYGLDQLRLTPKPRAAREFAFNWKVFMEGSLECYHCDYLHPGQHDCAPTRLSEPDLLPADPGAIVLRVGTTHPDASFVPPDYRCQFPPLPGLDAEGRHRMQWIVVLPNLLISCYPDGVRAASCSPWAPAAPGSPPGPSFRLRCWPTTGSRPAGRRSWRPSCRSSSRTSTRA